MNTRPATTEQVRPPQGGGQGLQPLTPAGAAGAPREQAPAFSIVMPLYNKAGYVQQAIRSVLAQSVPPCEVIVVDDGSTDEGPALVDALADPRVRLVRQSNAGVSVARNTGISLAQGDWVVFLDADDLHHPRLLEHLLRARQEHPDVQVLTAGYRTVPAAFPAGEADWPLPAHASVERIEDLRRRWMRSSLFFTGTIAVRTELLRQLQPCFQPGESYGEDLDLWFRLADLSPVAHVHAPLGAYRQDTAGSLVAQRAGGIMPAFLPRMRDNAHAGRIPVRFRRSALWYVAQQEITIARELLAAGQREPALRLLRSAGRDGFGWRWLRTVLMAARRELSRRRREPDAPDTLIPAD